MALQRILNILRDPKYKHTLGSMLDQCYASSILFFVWDFSYLFKSGSFFRPRITWAKHCTRIWVVVKIMVPSWIPIIIRGT